MGHYAGEMDGSPGLNQSEASDQAGDAPVKTTLDAVRETYTTEMAAWVIIGVEPQVVIVRIPTVSEWKGETYVLIPAHKCNSTDEAQELIRDKVLETLIEKIREMDEGLEE